MRQLAHIPLLLAMLSLAGCGEVGDEIDTSKRFIVAMLGRTESARCQALSHENVVWDLQHPQLSHFIDQLRQLREVPRRIHLGKKERQEIAKLLSVNDSEATIQHRASSGLFDQLMRQIEHLDAGILLETHLLQSQPDTLVVAIDLAASQATIVYISQLAFRGERMYPPQPLVDETLEALRLAP